MAATRIQSVDTLRGITIIAMILVNNPGSWNDVYAPLLHADWHGLTPTDLIFPFFLFIVGISISLAYQNKEGNKTTYKKILIRSLKLFGLGFAINLFTPIFPFIENLNTVRVMGVLQRIGIVFLISSILYLNVSQKLMIGITALILVGYFLLTGYIVLPNGLAPSFENSLTNWSNYVDYHILGNHMWRKTYDPEGLLGTLPSIATCLLGIIAGNILCSKKAANKLYLLLGFSFSLLTLGYLWSYYFPINKNFWTSSFVLVSGGWALLVLSLAYYIHDLKKVKTINVFTYVSRNAITIYFLSMIIAKTFYLFRINTDHNIHSWLFENLYQSFITDTSLASLLYALTVVSFYLFVGWYLYRKKIFFKV